nr:PREDICTED: ankyrin repeat and sterile alpha motif domain-containing protein 1B-like [Haliaeetus albicilla]
MWQCHLSAQDYRYYPVDGYSLLKRLPLHPPTGPRCPVQTVGQWLENIGLPQYENHLLANGFDNVQFMGSNVMEDQDLLEIGILNSGHRQRILQAIQLLPKMKQIGHDGYNPTSVAEWLDSIELGDYTKSFLINGYTSMDLVKKIWEIELINYTCFYIFFWWTCRLVCSKYKPIDNNPAEPVEIIDRPTELHNATQTPVTPESNLSWYVVSRENTNFTFYNTEVFGLLSNFDINRKKQVNRTLPAVLHQQGGSAYLHCSAKVLSRGIPVEIRGIRGTALSVAALPGYRHGRGDVSGYLLD